MIKEVRKIVINFYNRSEAMKVGAKIACGTDEINYYDGLIDAYSNILKVLDRFSDKEDKE